MDIRTQGRRIASNLTATVTILSIGLTGIASLVMWGTTAATGSSSSSTAESSSTGTSSQSGVVTQNTTTPTHTHATSSGS